MQTNVNSDESDTQANNNVNTTVGTDICQLSCDIENFAAEGAILIDALFDAVDGMADVPDHLVKARDRISCFATCVKRHLVLIGESTLRVNVLSQGLTR